MTPPPEPNDPLNPTDKAVVDTWFARQYQDTGDDLTTMLDLDMGLHDILLAGRHRDMGADLTEALDLATGLAAILHHTTRNEPPTTHFDNLADLLDWLSTAPTLRLIHRNRLRLIAIDTEILHLASDRDRARDLARALNRALDLDPDRDRDLDLALDLARARDRALALVLDLDRDLDRALALDLDRDLEGALDRALALDRDLALDLARALALDRALALAVDRARDIARALALDLALALSETVVRLGVGGLVRAISDQTSVDTSWLNPATIRNREVDRLRELCTDFTGVDLREAQLSGLDLVGVRWSRTTTQWPLADVDWIVAASEPVGNGVYVIREAAANGGAVVIPDPVSV